MEEFKIHVNPDQLRIKAGTVQTSISAMRSAISEISRTAKGFNNYWGVMAREAKADELEKIMESADMALLRLSEHPTDLLQMAGIYETAETQNTERSADLMTDVIV